MPPRKSLHRKKLGTKYELNWFKISAFEMNVVDVWLAYQGITKMEDIQDDLYNYMAEEMIDNTYNRFMIRRAEGMRRTIVDSDGDYVDDKKPLFGRINGVSRCGISLHVTPTKKMSKKRYGT